jgi:hypothetical protein
MGPKTRTCALFPVVSVFSCEARVVSCTIQRMKILENIYKICAVHSNFETTGSRQGIVLNTSPRGRGRIASPDRSHITITPTCVAVFLKDYLCVSQ